MTKRKRHLRPSIKKGIIILLTSLIGIGAFFLVYTYLINNLFDKPTSINEDAKTYKVDHCIAFYPDGSGEKGLTYVMDLCNEVNPETEEKVVIDYKVNKINDFLEIDYGQDHKYYTTSSYQPIKIDELNDTAKMMISDYIRYTLKSKNIDEAYTLDFLEKTYYPNITLETFDEYHFDLDNVYFHYPDYDTDIVIPLKYIGQALNVNLGQETVEYIRPKYINPDRKAIAITFDDGPSLEPECTDKVLNELYKYDSYGTFYVVGSRLYDKTEGIIQKGLSLGNEYGSHSCGHRNLKNLSREEIEEEVMDVVRWFKDKYNYDMKTYRPPYGAYNETVDEVVPLAAVLWDVDSIDWKLRDADAIINEVGNDIPNHSILLFHDIHKTSIEAVVDKGLIKQFINDGYQLVTVEDIAELRGVDLVQGVHLCWD